MAGGDGDRRDGRWYRRSVGASWIGRHFDALDNVEKLRDGQFSFTGVSCIASDRKLNLDGWKPVRLNRRFVLNVAVQALSPGTTGWAAALPRRRVSRAIGWALFALMNVRANESAAAVVWETNNSPTEV